MEIAHLSDDVAGVPSRTPRWAFWSAWAVPICLVPSSVWRAQLIAETGLADGGWYPLMLSLAEVSLGLLTVGLVYRWGELLPRWVPLLGGRRVPIRAAVIPATIGTAAITLLTTYGVLNRIFEWVKPATIEEARDLSTFDVPAVAELGGVEPWTAWLYAPSLAWGPLLAAVTWAYYRRRRHPSLTSSGL